MIGGPNIPYPTIWINSETPKNKLNIALKKFHMMKKRSSVRNPEVRNHVLCLSLFVGMLCSVSLAPGVWSRMQHFFMVWLASLLANGAVSWGRDPKASHHPMIISQGGSHSTDCETCALRSDASPHQNIDHA